MSDPAYNNRIIAEYLLGSLPAEESERLDELSFTDDEFAGTLAAAEKDLVDSYVLGELKGTDLDRFRSHYLASPYRRQKVEFAQAFLFPAQKRAGAQPASERAIKDSVASQRESRWFSAFEILKPRAALQWGAAFAALVLLVAGGWLVVEKARLRQQIAQTPATDNAAARPESETQDQLEAQGAANAKAAQETIAREERERQEQKLKEEQRLAEQRAAKPESKGVGVASFILAPQMRGIGKLPEVSIPAGSNHVVMHLQLDPNEFRAYRVYLLDGPGGKAVWRSGPLRARSAESGKTLDVRLRADLLKPRTYVLQVSGVSDGTPEVVGDYPFRVVK